tara:strand:+ start:359 stop:910 length:552 start_codon:yes stop_codon:yes gene_type:complete
VENISDKVLKLKSIIESKRETWTLKEFQNFYHNVDVNKEINDNEKELLAKTCGQIIEEKFPKRQSKKILGDKGIEGKELMEEINNILTKEFDWSENDVETRVKNGGDMISGRLSVSYYISYKSKKSKMSAGFHYGQKTVASDPYLEVDIRKVGTDEEERKTFTVALRDEALDLYRNYLSKIIE